MRWFFRSYRRLKQLGILGMNRRNAAYILDHNPRALYPLVDDKLRMQHLCTRIGVPTPAVYGEIFYHSMLRHLADHLGEREEFVIKPNRGSAGRGVLVIVARKGKDYVRHNGECLRLEQIRQHVSDILSGMYSLGGRPDRAILQQRIHLHPAFEPIAYKGIPDVRVVLYRHQPAMAMLRLPTKASNGRANLHQGGIGAGVDLVSGITHHAVQHDRHVMSHPDTGIPVIGTRVPYWREVLDMSRRVAEAVHLGYIGVDIVIDAEQGPMLLEANARPGLAIQIANARGLVPRLAEIDAMLDRPRTQQAVEHEAIAGKVGERLRRSA
ncbi:MAG TPA: alpha-L-glutamate ligase-like protein [Gemmataceae bacterium]|jgi:alpha-L-glutamate ligase-like protein|nr:alpha-L-glutamate ligase-like protein [Gemmataceae bacterium]